jgi:hypothetical protein
MRCDMVSRSIAKVGDSCARSSSPDDNHIGLILLGFIYDGCRRRSEADDAHWLTLNSPWLKSKIRETDFLTL